MDFTETPIGTEHIFEGRVIKVRRDTVRLPDGNTATRELVGHPGGVAVAAVTDSRKMLMVRQYRIAAKEMMLEVPAGKLEYGENPLECGVRELEEETGYKAEHVEHLGEYYATPGYCEEKINIYMATGLKKTEQNLDDGEFLTVEQIDIDELYNMVMNNEIDDMKTAVAILKVKAKLG
jgi:ADP-ribose pyrophosphatase